MCKVFDYLLLYVQSVRLFTALYAYSVLFTNLYANSLQAGLAAAAGPTSAASAFETLDMDASKGLDQVTAHPGEVSI